MAKTKTSERQKIQKSKYIMVLAVTTLIFIIGILLGNYFAAQKLSQLDQLTQTLRTDTLAIEIQYDLIAENPCDAVTDTPLAEQLYELATKLDYMESRLGEDDETVLDLKEYYMLLELRHWMFNKKTNLQCGDDKSLILYFYANKDDCPSCEQQGFILTWLRKNYPENVLVYAFDYNIENTALDTIKTIYGVENTPAVVFNEQAYNHFLTKSELEAFTIQVMEDAKAKQELDTNLNETEALKELVEKTLQELDAEKEANNSDN
ncbi:hypothetical protein HOK51_03065 [Candidatus Woesearchaeota archaeon]|mgnify:CR=1 FL=1|jgi:hypothetical protein|nr:hypothetical protein [Candidatus Woesearchaeota archaeon]MBT6518799.1 hypothetical protein [Candidatus Woesearchaeota archaeon]MBT7367938.1 hypothetical protein [Candidatus Woesearchaeota archaeon]